MYITKVFLQFVNINSLAPGRYGCNLQLVIFKLISGIGKFSISCEMLSGESYKTSLMIN